MFKSVTQRLAAPNGLATAFWVRVNIALAQAAGAGDRKLIAGTLGLAAFGHSELEYAPTAGAPAALASQAMAASEYLLSSGATLEDGQTIGVAGGTQFHLKLKTRGNFAPGPVITLEAP